MDLPCRHTCLIYDGSPTAHINYLMSLMVLRLKMRFRCMFLGSPAMVAAAFTGLSGAGIDPLDEMKRGSLILTSDRSYLKDGVFDSDIMLGMLGQAVDRAVKDGYEGLWATGDMTWELGAEDNLSEVLKYECGLEKMFREKPALEGICQYSQKTLPSQVIADALLTHSAVFVNETLFGANLSYRDPDELLRTPPPQRSPAEVAGMFKQLQLAA